MHVLTLRAGGHCCHRCYSGVNLRAPLLWHTSKVHMSVVQRSICWCCVQVTSPRWSGSQAPAWAVLCSAALEVWPIGVKGACILYAGGCPK
jgi:hypothetical protein